MNQNLRKIQVDIETPHGTSTESLWAEVVSPDTARIQNVPFFTGAVAWRDVVRHDDQGKVVEVLEHTFRTVRATYIPRPNDVGAKQELMRI